MNHQKRESKRIVLKRKALAAGNERDFRGRSVPEHWLELMESRRCTRTETP